MKMQTPDKNYHWQLQYNFRILHYLQCFKNDFIVHDKKLLDGYTGIFILGARLSGTDTIILDVNRIRRLKSIYEEYKFAKREDSYTSVKPPTWHGFWRDRTNNRFFIGENGIVREVDKYEAIGFFINIWDNGDSNLIFNQQEYRNNIRDGWYI